MKMPQIEAFFWLACKFRIRDFMLNKDTSKEVPFKS